VSNAPLQRVASSKAVGILDIDYHHGNGTQAIFYTDPAVLYCSLHAHPDDDYPYWGEASERGVGAGEGFNRNWPLPQGTDDAQYLAALDEALGAIRDFMPRYLVVSAGFDVTCEGLCAIGRRIAGLGLPTLIVQEGGYRLEEPGRERDGIPGGFRRFVAGWFIFAPKLVYTLSGLKIGCPYLRLPPGDQSPGYGCNAR